ncbi:DEAD/DEAH box helicase [Marivivens marinus]|uniref:DEAD/DEAH box helicase n=1 Tax=Marivivens marinus TaxID=3110173 RepID=UPI003B845C11
MDFDMLGLSPRLVSKLQELGIKDPTPIQAQAIPHAMNGRDVMGLAQTGTGKTAAFGLPMLNALLSDGGRPTPKTAKALVLAPTRELAKQIADNLAAFSEGTHLKTVLVVGGAGITGQARRLEKGCAVLVATPGRLLDLIDRGAVRLNETRFLVLDEADQMLDLGFIHALRKIAPMLAEERQTMLFSATMPKQMNELAQTYLTDPVRVQVNPPGQAADKIEQGVHYVAKAAKIDLLIELLDQHRDERALVFGRTKHGMEKLSRVLAGKGFGVAAIHGNKSQGQRDRAIKSFKDGEVKVLVATDVAARGIDIPDVRHVYNFELPNVPENYVHRIGRTARAGADGMAVALCSPDEMGEMRDIEKVLKAPIPVLSGRPWERAEEPEKPKGGRGRGGPRRGGQPAVGASRPARNAGPTKSRPRRNRAKSRSA